MLFDNEIEGQKMYIICKYEYIYQKKNNKKVAFTASMPLHIETSFNIWYMD